MTTRYLRLASLETFGIVRWDATVRKLTGSPFHRLLSGSPSLEYLHFAGETLAEAGTEPDDYGWVVIAQGERRRTREALETLERERTMRDVASRLRRKYDVKPFHLETV